MNKIIISLALLIGFFATSGHAASMAQSKLDCQEILERWATDPDSVSKQLVDECKGVKGSAVPAIVPFAGSAEQSGDAQATAAAADPCAGPGAAGSVHCWGPWKSLAPAAGAAIEPPVLVPAEEYPLRPELAQQFDPNISSCEPGQPCGFATVVESAETIAPSDQTTFAEFALARDGATFAVVQGEDNTLVSVTGMTTDFVDRPDEYENMVAAGGEGDQVSLLVARVIRGGDTSIEAAADAWVDANIATDESRSGYFAWGIATPQADLDILGSNGTSVAFSGPMSVDNNTIGSVTVNFGTQATWNGTWANPGYSFDAGGAVIGVDMLSDATQFSSNVSGDSFVRGAVLGQRGSQSIAHIIDVELAGVGRIKDVGLLRERAVTPLP
ncbi:MAG: hypothetical protein ACN4GT_07135 [Gammaproteobacteria bacterium]